MDTRKLEAHIDHDHGGRIESEGWGITATVDHAEDPEMIRELVRRWNAHHELVEALRLSIDYIQKSPCDPDIYPDQLEAWIKLKGNDIARALLNTLKP